MLLSHGDQDAIIAFHYQRTAAKALRAAGCAVTTQAVPRHGHGITRVQVDEVVDHLEAALHPLAGRLQQAGWP